MLITSLGRESKFLHGILLFRPLLLKMWSTGPQPQPWKRGGNAESQLLRGSIHSLFLGILGNAFGGEAVSAVGNPQAGKVMPGLGPCRRIGKQRRNGEKRGNISRTAARQWEPERREFPTRSQSHRAWLSRSAGGPCGLATRGQSTTARCVRRGLSYRARGQGKMTRI